MKLICKLFNFLLSLFDAAITTVGYALKTVGTVVVEVLGGVLDAAGDVVSGLFTSNPLVWGLIGAGALFFLTRDKDKESTVRVETAVPQNYGGENG